MGKIIAITNQKGGVGKTTTAINLAASLAVAGENILVIDSDPQGNLTSGFGIKKDQWTDNLYDIYVSNLPVEDAIVRIPMMPELSVLPTSIKLFSAEIELLDQPDRETRLRKILHPLRKQFRYIIIDCSPSFGLLTLNALVACDAVIVPVQCEFFAVEGLSMLIRLLWRIRSSFNESLHLNGIVITMYNRHINLYRRAEEDIRNRMKNKVYDTVIPRNVTLAEAPRYGEPAVLYAPQSPGAQAYIALAKEMLGKEMA